MLNKRLLSPIFVFFIVTLLIELLFRADLLNTTLFPAPSIVLKTFIDARLDFQMAFIQSLIDSIYGFTLSGLIGVIFSLLFVQVELLKFAILPYAIFFQTVPIIAIAPLLVIYFGFGSTTVIISSMIVAIFPIIASTMIGLESINRDQDYLFQIYNASSWQKLIKLRLPHAYLQIYSGLKTAAGLSVIGVVAGEFVAGGGLGAMIDSARTQQRTDIVFIAILLLSLIGLILIGSLKILNLFINKVRPYGLQLKD